MCGNEQTPGGTHATVSLAAPDVSAEPCRRTTMLKETLNNSRVALALRRVCSSYGFPRGYRRFLGVGLPGPKAPSVNGAPRSAVLPVWSSSAPPADPAPHAGSALNTVDGTETPDAWTLTARVEAVLTADTELSDALIRVDASGDTVILQGFVDSPADMLRALDLVGDVAGVETIANRLQLPWW